MDYKELISKLRKKDGCNCECLDAATAIETLLAERDAAVEDLHMLAPCLSCIHSETSSAESPCLRCGGKKWEWRGPVKGDAK